LIDAIDRDLANGIRPEPRDGLKNVWCASASISGGLLLMNLVGTQPRKWRPRVIVSPVTGLPALTAGPNAPVLTSKQVAEILADFP
jgi:hypothetical protein